MTTEERAARASALRSLFDTLNLAEVNVLTHLMAGFQNKGAAINLGVSLRTVELYRARVMQKMKATSTADLVKRVCLCAPEVVDRSDEIVEACLAGKGA